MVNNYYIMLSKQDKLKYGEELRRQMKERQEKKKMQEMQKRGMRKSPTDTRVPIQSDFYTDTKQALQNRFESQPTDYYGRPGGGAPNRQSTQGNYQGIPSQLSYNPNIQNPIPKMKTTQQQIPYSQPALYNQNYNYNPPQIPPQSFENLQRGFNEQAQFYQKNNQPSYMSIEQMSGYGQMQQSFNNNNNPYAPPTYTPMLNVPVQAVQGAPQRIPTDRSITDPYQQFERSKPQQIDYNNYQNQPSDIYQNPIQQINQKHEAFRQKTQQNQQLMQIHKRGGRNLLQLENMTIDQQQIKQKQKQEMRRQLELQMKQAQQRKKQQLQKIKREQLEEERKTKQYIEMQQRRIQEEEQKRIDKQREIEMQNARNLQDRKKLQEQAKQKLLREKMKDQIPVQTSIQNSPKGNKKQPHSRQSELPIDETVSQNSSSSQLQNNFNSSGRQRQYYENEKRMERLDQERRKDQQRYNRQKNLQAVTNEIRRLKDQIDQQNHLFLREIQKVKLQSEMAQNQKRKAQAQIENLKMQLKNKIEDDNERLLLALQRQDKLVKQQQDYYAPPRRTQERRPPPQQIYSYNNNNNYVENLRPTRDQKFVKKQYEVPAEQAKRPPPAHYNQNYNKKLMESNISDQNELLASLPGNSKKIPLNIPDQLSMSKLQDFARRTQFFKNDGKSGFVPEKKNKFKYQQSIAQEDQDRAQSRVAPRQPSKSFKNQKDQLQRLVQSRDKQRQQGWGQLSSVNSDITKQIEELLRKKDNMQRLPSKSKYEENSYSNKNNDRPTSHLSNAGKRALNGGLQYDGASIGTLNSNAGVGTIDIDKIHRRNERRLNQLKNLGVETINTNNDEQFSKLDLILNKYKESRVY